MPGLTGLDLACEIHRIRPTVPVLLLTGYSERTTPERLADAGITEVILKPAQRDRLIASVRATLAPRADAE